MENSTLLESWFKGILLIYQIAQLITAEALDFE